MSENSEGDDPELYRPFIVGINGSPRKHGASARNLEKTLESVEKLGGQVKIVHLIDLNMAFCEGCDSEYPSKCTYPCIHNDDTRMLHELLLKADGFILATPTNWLERGGLTENFIDKLTALETMNRFMLKRKVAGVTVCCELYGAKGVAKRLKTTFRLMGMKIPRGSVIYYNHITDPISNIFSLPIIGYLADSLVEFLIKFIDGRLPKGIQRHWHKGVRLIKQKDMDRQAKNLIETARKLHKKAS